MAVKNQCCCSGQMAPAGSAVLFVLRCFADISVLLNQNNSLITKCWLKSSSHGRKVWLKGPGWKPVPPKPGVSGIPTNTGLETSHSYTERISARRGRGRLYNKYELLELIENQMDNFQPQKWGERTKQMSPTRLTNNQDKCWSPHNIVVYCAVLVRFPKCCESVLAVLSRLSQTSQILTVTILSMLSFKGLKKKVQKCLWFFHWGIKWVNMRIKLILRGLAISSLLARFVL